MPGMPEQHCEKLVVLLITHAKRCVQKVGRHRICSRAMCSRWYSATSNSASCWLGLTTHHTPRAPTYLPVFVIYDMIQYGKLYFRALKSW